MFTGVFTPTNGGRVISWYAVPTGYSPHGKGSGRESASDITVFDRSSLAIQDLYIAKAVINAWRHQHA
ncbi:hypothetical protein [Dickeya chrysanthemi]|uniref:hypothetical protein n=1 Tax=Dickeya chrysanthemi TaxID=556 RepID=UPI001CF1F636|nr:hypothetical protein [Dickeya chrysanthemi]MCA7007935.1 hypothetical protein [Dickeya chrysanthemi]